MYLEGSNVGSVGLNAISNVFSLLKGEGNRTASQPIGNNDAGTSYTGIHFNTSKHNSRQTGRVSSNRSNIIRGIGIGAGGIYIVSFKSVIMCSRLKKFKTLCLLRINFVCRWDGQRYQDRWAIPRTKERTDRYV